MCVSLETLVLSLVPTHSALCGISILCVEMPFTAASVGGACAYLPELPGQRKGFKGPFLRSTVVRFSSETHGAIFVIISLLRALAIMSQKVSCIGARRTHGSKGQCLQAHARDRAHQAKVPVALADGQKNESQTKCALCVLLAPLSARQVHPGESHAAFLLFAGRKLT